MRKYMRKCNGAGGGEVAAMEVTQVAGVRTRSRATRAAAMAGAAGHGISAFKRRKSAAAEKEKEVEDHSCYLHLRSRRLFMTTMPGKAAKSGTRRPRAGIEGAAAAGISRCSSTASSMDVISEVGGGDQRDSSRSGGGMERGEESNNDLESSVSNSEGKRESREMTPSSEFQGDVSDLESEAGRMNHRRISPAVARTRRPLLPPVAEIDEFFAAAEKTEADRFAAKYNFDVVKGVPLDGGRFEWAPLKNC